MKTILFAIMLLLPPILSSSGVADVFINEVELSPYGGADQWVELYNSGDEDVDISSWSITHFLGLLPGTKASYGNRTGNSPGYATYDTVNRYGFRIYDCVRG